MYISFTYVYAQAYIVYYVEELTSSLSLIHFLSWGRVLQVIIEVLAHAWSYDDIHMELWNI